MLLLPCAEVTRLVSKSLDQKLPLIQRLIIRIHLFRCQSCTRFRKQMFFLKHLLHSKRSIALEVEDTTSPPLSSEARERLKRSLHRQDPQ